MKFCSHIMVKRRLVGNKIYYTCDLCHAFMVETVLENGMVKGSFWSDRIESMQVVKRGQEDGKWSSEQN